MVWLGTPSKVAYAPAASSAPTLLLVVLELQLNCWSSRTLRPVLPVLGFASLLITLPVLLITLPVESHW